jgi:imidazoleglycerol-phosphate dehydratase/histidinol-phosphatase
MAKKILFLDRDGTLVKEPGDKQIDELHKIKFCADVIPSLLQLKKEGFSFIMVSNQDGVGTPSFPQNNFQVPQDFILNVFSSQGIDFNQIFICPHKEEDKCRCRKPQSGLLDDFLRNNEIDYSQSWVIGDRDTDGEFAQNMGLPFLKITDFFGWERITQSILQSEKIITLHRNTKETSIELRLDTLDCECIDINTPIPFFSHMLEQIAKHGGFGLRLQASGDVAVDDHHLIEDTAILLGESLKKVLGNKHGIERYGFVLPMDESLASIAIDLCGRSFCRFEGKFTREFVGGMSTEMVPHFFKSFCSALNATMHLQVTGENNHHMIEACFKVLGRSLRQAMNKTGSGIPSTKGIL